VAVSESFRELQCRRYPPDGDVTRWVQHGPLGHVNYGGGPVQWVPDPESSGEHGG
jgi:hypothetical protein